MANIFHIKKNILTALPSPLKIYYHTLYQDPKLHGSPLTGLYTHAIIADCKKMEWPAISMFKLSSIRIYLSTCERKLPTNLTSMSSSESSLHLTQFIILTFIV